MTIIIVIVAAVALVVGYAVGLAHGLAGARPFQESAMRVLTDEVRRLNRERDIIIAEREAGFAARARQAAR